jgi:tRNA nucleotidyltransferase/poly(A) polymerase
VATVREFPKLRLPEGVIELSRDLHRAGFQAWCVGGAVRDALLGHPHLDWDLATDATPDDVRKLFGRKRTIPVGIDFGTVGVLDRGGVMHEVTTFRRDVHTDGRHAVVEFGASLDEDLSRRDFTINAIAVSPESGEIRDPFGGREDLARGIVRAVGEPNARMREDRLRALRGIRFSARFGFPLDPATWAAIRDSAPHLTRLSAERVKQELDKTMDQVAAPSDALRLWRESGAAAVLVPELQAASDIAVAAVDHAAQPGPKGKPGRRLVRYAVLLADRQPSEVAELASRLRFSKHEAQWIAALVSRWATLGEEIAATLRAGEPDRTTLRRWVARIGRTYLHDFFRVAEARWSALRMRETATAPAAQAVQLSYRRCRDVALTEPVDLRDLAVDGDDLREAGIAPGPALGKILSRLLESVIEDPGRNVRDRLLDEARRLHSQLNQS